MGQIFPKLLPSASEQAPLITIELEVRSINSNPSQAATPYPFLNHSVSSSGVRPPKTDNMDTDAANRCSGSLAAEEPARYEAAATTELAQPAHPSSANSALLELPAELRNRIYEEVFQENVIDLTEVSRRRTQAKPRTADHPLLLVCRQIRAEARGLFFSLSTFKIPSRPQLYTFRHLDPFLLGLITKIDLDSFWLRDFSLRSASAGRLHDQADIAQNELILAREHAVRNYPQLNSALRLRGNLVLPSGELKYAENPIIACSEMLKSPNGERLCSPFSIHVIIADAVCLVQFDFFEPAHEQMCQRRVNEMEKQMTFFEYDHHDYAKCYHRHKWGFCNCPKKANA